MGLRELDYALLALVLVLQFWLAVRMTRAAGTPAFSGYLWICLIAFVPWVMSGASTSLPCNIFLVGAKVCCAVEAAYLVTHLAHPDDRHRWIPLWAALVAVAILLIGQPDAYPNYPAAAYYMRIAGHLIAMAIAVGTFLYAWNHRVGGFGQAHLAILAVYFGAMLLASRAPEGWWMQAHCGLMVVHAGCMASWLWVTRTGRQESMVQGRFT